MNDRLTITLDLNDEVLSKIADIEGDYADLLSYPARPGDPTELLLKHVRYLLDLGGVGSAAREWFEEQEGLLDEH